MKGGVVIIAEKFVYFLRRGMENALNRKATSLASVGIVTATLILFGIFIAVEMNIGAMMDKLGSGREINIYIERDANGRPIEDIEAELRGINGVSDVRFLSRDERLKNAIESGYVEDTTFVGGENPLRDSFILTISDEVAADGISAAAESVEGVEETIKNSDILSAINTVLDRVGKVGIWLMILMILISMYIIKNTIQLGIESRSDEIKIMRTIGATDGFIIAPFVFQAVLLSLTGSIVAAIICIYGYSLAAGSFMSFMPQNIAACISTADVARAVLAAFPSIAVLIGIIGSFSSVYKYLRRKY